MLNICISLGIWLYLQTEVYIRFGWYVIDIWIDIVIVK